MVAHIVGEELQQESGHTATDTEEEVHTGEDHVGWAGDPEAGRWDGRGFKGTIQSKPTMLGNAWWGLSRKVDMTLKGLVG